MSDDEKELREALAKALGIPPERVDLSGLDEAEALGRRFDGDVDAELEARRPARKSHSG